MELKRQVSATQILRQHFRAFPAAAGDLTRNEHSAACCGKLARVDRAQGLPLGFMMKLGSDSSRLWRLLWPTAGELVSGQPVADHRILHVTA
jgi:hypothetical protein